MFFTLEDYRKIEEYLKQNSKKDSDFPSLNPEDPLNENDFITIVHNDVNHKVNLLNFADFLDSLLTLYKYLTKIEELTEEERKSFAKVDLKLKDLQTQIDSFNEHGVSVSTEFGNDPYISISQKTMTEAINKIWQKFEDITGEILQGINMVVTPTFFVSEDGCDVHISANTVETNGIFEKIQFFVDGEFIYEDTFKEYVSFDHHLDIKNEYDYVIMCKAKIMGVVYTRQQVITRYNEFYIGAGDTYADVMDSAHAKQLNGTMRHNYDVEFNNGDKLIIVMGASLRSGFIRADLNGAEIALAEETVTIDGKDYVVLTSETWSAGEYNIDING